MGFLTVLDTRASVEEMWAKAWAFVLHCQISPLGEANDGVRIAAIYTGSRSAALSVARKRSLAIGWPRFPFTNPSWRHEAVFAVRALSH